MTDDKELAMREVLEIRVAAIVRVCGGSGVFREGGIYYCPLKDASGKACRFQDTDSAVKMRDGTFYKCSYEER